MEKPIFILREEDRANTLNFGKGSRNILSYFANNYPSFIMEYTYHNPLSLTSQFSFCGLPFRLDTYAGCGFGCKYCFARSRGGNIDSKKLKAADPQSIIRRFQNALSGGEGQMGIISQLIKRRVPLHFGGMSDPFQPIEQYYRSSFIVLEYLSKIDYPLVISTKSTMVKEDSYLSVLKSFSNLLVQFSFSTMDDARASVIEPNVEKPSILAATIESLGNAGIKTSIRWQPFIPFFSEDPETFVNAISNTGAIHLGFEHLKIPLERKDELSNKIRPYSTSTLLSYYLSNSSKIDGRELVLGGTDKFERVKLVKEIVNRKGLTFGAADNEFQYLSDTHCCCSGVDQLSGFENWNKFQISYAVKESYDLKMNEIRFSQIKDQWKPSGAVDKFINSKSRIPKNGSHNNVERYVKERWQNLESSFNPTKFSNVTFNNKYDECGMKIYNWSIKL